MSNTLLTAAVALVFLLVGYGLGYSTKTGKNALSEAAQAVKEAIPTPPADDEPIQRGFYER